MSHREQGHVELPKKIVGKGLNDNENKRKANDYCESNHCSKSTRIDDHDISIENNLHTSSTQIIGLTNHRIVLDDSDSEDDSNRTNSHEMLSPLEYDTLFLRKNTTTIQSDASIIITDGSHNIKYKSKTNILGDTTVSGYDLIMTEDVRHKHVAEPAEGELISVETFTRQKWTPAEARH
jgi:hypothetical protein